MKSTPRPVQAGKVAWGFVVWLLLFALAGAALCLTPLFNVLGFESSLVLALLASLAAVHRGSAVVARARLRLRATDRDLIDAAPLRRVISLVGQATVATWMLCAVPLLMLIVNGLRVRNCNYLSGLAVLRAAAGLLGGDGGDGGGGRWAFDHDAGPGTWLGLRPGLRLAAVGGTAQPQLAGDLCL
jgi:hypothetical protein